MSRFSRGERPSSQALRACTINAPTPGALDGAGQRLERRLRVLIVDADATFDGDGQLDRGRHRRNAVADENRLGHQAGAEAALLHAFGGTADVEIYLVVAELLGDARALRELPRIAAAKLQGNRVLGHVVGQEPRAVTVKHGAGGDHFGIDQRPAREQAVERTGSADPSIHHRGMQNLRSNFIGLSFAPEAEASNSA
jgi:hypothetical protein